MSVLRHIAFLLTLLGCASTQLPGTLVPRGDFDREVAAWNAAGLPDASKCQPPRQLVASGQGFVDYCMQAACGEPRVPPCADSCFDYRSRTIVLSPGHTGPGWVAHETLHALQLCTGLAMDHSDPRAWGADGLLHRLGG